MSRARLFLLFAMLPVALASSGQARELEQLTLTRALREELGRSLQLVLPGAPRPHYLAYTVLDSDLLSIGAEFGGLLHSSRNRQRHLRIDLRIGDTRVDNSMYFHPSAFLFRQHQRWFPLDDDRAALRRSLWLGTDDAYKGAVDILLKKRAHLASHPRDTDHPGDFSPAPPARGAKELAGALPDPARWEGVLRRLSAAYREFPEVQAGELVLGGQILRRHLVSSEGSLAYESRSIVTLGLNARVQAEDGMVLWARGSIVVPSAELLPSEEALLAEVRRRLRELVARRSAPVGDDYTGPVLFEGEAAAQVLRAVLVRQLSGTPPPSGLGGAIGGSAFEGLTDRLVLSPAFTVVDDPTLERWQKSPLVGRYHFDDEGVVGERVTLIERGKLKAFLMSRTPRKGLSRSNGHARHIGFGHVGAISNLLVSAKGVPRRELIRRLLAEARKRGEPHAYVVRQLSSATCTPFGCRGGDRIRVASKLGLDGKEVPVRGLRLGQIPVTALRQILAAGDQPTVQSVAGSGRWTSASFPAMPTSLVTPALLFADVPIKKLKSPRRALPILPSPHHR